MPGKLGMKMAQRKSVLRNMASSLLWYGKIETTKARAKQLKSYAEKILTLAINSYEDIIETEVTKTIVEGKKNEEKQCLKNLICLKFQPHILFLRTILHVHLLLEK